MLLLDTSFLVQFEEEVEQDDRQGPAHAVVGAHRREPMAISIVTLGEFAEGFEDPLQFAEFIGRYQVLQLSRAIAWRTAMLQTSLRQRLGENDAWIAATALAYDAQLVGRDSAFTRVPRLKYLKF